MKQYERDILRNIDEYGCSVTSVFDPDGIEPRFSYSIGISKSCGAPELIVLGLNSEIGHWLVNEYRRRVGKGKPSGQACSIPAFWRASTYASSRWAHRLGKSTCGRRAGYMMVRNSRLCS
ncbi:MAG: DUF4262 domain-containing protein [Burkholderiales bacterium]|nr:DUF4262 domain-containing protein [Burkholderiales bacterium]